MSKIGRKVITFSNAVVQVNENTVTIGGSKAKLVHELPAALIATVDGKNLKISLRKGEKESKENKMLWGLHRALIANKITGLEKGFEQVMKIVGLGFKAQLTGKKLTFTLGYTHKIDLDLPTDVTVEVDKTGQILTFKSNDKFLLGNICDRVRSFRPPEPYKGTGVMKENEVIVRKAGKTKASAGA